MLLFKIINLYSISVNWIYLKFDISLRWIFIPIFHLNEDLSNRSEANLSGVSNIQSGLPSSYHLFFILYHVLTVLALIYWFTGRSVSVYSCIIFSNKIQNKLAWTQKLKFIFSYFLFYFINLFQIMDFWREH